MKICLITDLHLPDAAGAVQYKVLKWILLELTRRNVDLVVFAGDYSANGLESSLKRFEDSMAGLSVPLMVIPGNSDFRTKETVEYVRNMASSPLFEKDGMKVIGIMDGEGTIPQEIWELLDHADDNTVLCGHHPLNSIRIEDRERFSAWLETHPGVTYFCGHNHLSRWVNDQVFILPAADPDKSIGENPAITYYDTETKEIVKVHYECPIPADFRDYLGISCRNPIDDVPYAMEHDIRHLEVRGDFDYLVTEPVKAMLQRWRSWGGITLSIHAPDIFEKDQVTLDVERWESFINAVNVLDADRITLHVPNTPVARATDEVLDDIAVHVAGNLNRMPAKVKVGIENMHMNPGEPADERRRFGYLPEEVLRFVSVLRKYTTHSVGTHLDVGHARNNAPFSQKYPIGSWYCLVGPQANGYHIHQVVMTEHGMENHMPIDNWNGSLISFASFFREWEDGVMAKAPVFLEIRPKDGYRITVEMM